MRILFVHRGYYPSLAGAEAMARLLAAQIQRRGHTVHLCMAARQPTALSLMEDGLAVSALPSLEPDQVQQVIGWKPDIVHAIDTVEPDFPRAALTMARHWRVPFVITPASAIDTWRDVEDTLAVCRSADRVFVLTNAESARFQSLGVSAERLVSIGQGASLSPTWDAAGFRRKHGISGPLVLFLGRKIRFKGYHLLLEASGSIWTRHPDTTLLFMGPRWDTDCAELFERFADPRIIELDALDEHEKHSALRACDLLCLPSMIDVFPLVFVEAWTCGKPVVATPFPGVADVVRHGIDGVIAEPDPHALAQAIAKLLDNPELCRAMGATGQQRVVSELNWEAIADQIEICYIRCCRD
ncbi:MAG: hypothetical protein OHK0022_11760 [Roseiflexaceae bacterium]